MTNPSRPVRQDILLATTVSDRHLAAFPTSFDVQRKFKGKRFHVQWINNFPILLSSMGTIICFMEHIQAAMLELPQMPWDGELYVHGWTQETINGVTGRTVDKHEDSHLVEAHIFDLAFSGGTQTDRTEALEILRSLIKHPLYLAENVPSTKSTWVEHCSIFLKEGYEGIILRHPKGRYRIQNPAYRSPQLLKYKPTERDTYLIIGFKEGTERLAGSLGSILVQPHDGGASFYVGTGKVFTDYNRKKLWQERDSLIGKQLVVKHEPIETVGGIPICTVGMEIKEQNRDE